MANEIEHKFLLNWIGENVSNDNRYFNSNLAINPFTTLK